MNKKNDWLASLLFQPNMDFQDFANNDITPDNTELKRREAYTEIQEVRDAFSDNGVFNEAKFDNFYQSALSMYNLYANEKFTNKLLETYEYDLFDYFAPAGAKLKDNLPRVKTRQNPERRSSGLLNLRGLGEATMSAREIAQQNKVFNYDTQKFEDWTPEDKGGLFKALSRPTLVLASWDEDGEHTFNGRRIRHSKGELKYNEFGETYYETLGDREIYGKQVLAYADTLTREGTWLNKYDFFDSDGLDKSTIGTISKLVFTVGPMLIPYVGNAYGALTAGTALSQLIPTLMKSINGILTGDNSSDFAKSLNKAEGWTQRFNTSASDYSQEHLVSFENLGQLVTDISSQLFQQRVIGEIPGLLSKAPTSLRTRKLGQRMSLAYMAGTSSQQIYSEFKEAGADDRIAGLGMIASIGAMYKLMTLDYFRDMLFKGTYLDENPVKEATKSLAKITSENLNRLSVATPKQAANFVVKASRFIEKQALKTSANPLISRSVNEAVEEVLEEVSQDSVKALFKGLDALGIPVNNTGESLDFGFTPQDFGQRYAMSFFGGALGGPIFELHGQWQNRLKGISNKIAQQGQNETLQEVVYLVRQGRTQELKDQLEILRKKGKLGNTNLSGMSYELIEDGGENPIKWSQAAEGESQNDVIYNQVIDYIDRIDELMSYEGLKVPEEVLQQFELAKAENKPYDPIAQTIIDSGIHSRVFQDFNDISTRMVQVSAKLNNLLAPKSTESSDPTSSKERDNSNLTNREVLALQTQLENLRNQRDQILNGERNDYYFGQALFALDNEVNSKFTDLNIYNYTKAYYGKDYNSLTEDERFLIDQNYKEYSELDAKDKTFQSYDLYLKLSEKVKPILDRVKEQRTQPSQLFEFGRINFNVIHGLLENAKQIESKIEELENLEDQNDDTKDEINKLQSDLEQVRTLEQSYSQNLSLLLAPELSQQGEELLQRPIESLVAQGQIDAYAQSILDFYNYAKANRIPVDIGDTDLNILLENVKKVYTEQNQSPWQMYQEAINNIVDTDFDFVMNNYDEGLLDDQYRNPKQIQIKGLLENFETQLGTNNEAALSTFNEFIQILNDSLLTEQMVSDIIQAVQQKINDRPVTEFINEYYNVREGNLISPIYQLLSEFDFALDGELSTLLEILKSEENRFANTKDIQDYIIENDSVEFQLKELNSFIGAIHAILDGSTNLENEGLNYNINQQRAKIDKDLLPEIDLETALTLSSDLNRLANKLDLLLSISKQNSEQKLRIQRDITINMRQKFIEKLLDENSLIKTAFNEVFGVDLDQMWTDHESFGDVTPENFDLYEKSIINFETEIFKQIYNRFNNDEISSKLVSLFNPDELYKQLPTYLYKDTQNVTDYDALIYLATIITTPSINFYSELKGIVSDETYDKAPIFSQEHAVRIGYSMVANKELFNKITDKLLDPTLNVDSYISDKTKLYNFHLTFGGAGTGKTTAIGYMLRTLLNDNSSFISLAPSSKQAQKLNDALKLEKSKVFNKSEFINQILGRSLNTDDYINYDANKGESGHLNLSENVIPLTTELFDNGKRKILFIDEVTFFNEAELALISRWALANNVMVFAFGDIKQNSVNTVINSKINVHGGVEDTFHIKSPNLSATLRPNNIAKNDNYTALNSILEAVINDWNQNPNNTIVELNNFTKTKLSNGISLRYFKSNTQFVGEKIVQTDDEVIALANLLSKLSDDVALITDNPVKYQTLENIKVISLNDVQGSEFEYVLIDKKWDTDEFTSLRDLYTLTQRSTKGSIILNNGVKGILNITDVFDNTVNTDISFDQTALERFKTWRLQSLNDLSPLMEYTNLEYENESYTPNETTTDTTQEVIARQKEFESTPDKVTTKEFSSQSDPSASNISDISLEPTLKDNEILSNSVVDETSNEDNKSEENIAKSSQTVNGQEVVNTTQSESKTVVSKKASNSFVDTPSTGYLNNDSFFNWSANEMWDYEKSNDNSLFKVLNLNGRINKQQYQKLINTLGGYYKFGYYKNPTKIQRILNNKLNLIYPNNRNILNSILNNLSTNTFNIIPINEGRNGLFVSTININGIQTNIPLFITAPNFGEYTGEISLIKGPTFETGEEVNNYIGSINPDNMFTFHDQYIIPVVNPAKDDISDEGVRSFLFTRKNNGKVFAPFTDDPLVNTTAFEKSLSPTLSSDNEVVYLIQDDQKFALMGMQKTMTFSEVVLQSRERVNNLMEAIKSVQPKDRREVFNKYDGINSWVVYTDRFKEFLTETVNISRENPNIKSALFNSMMDYLTQKRQDNADKSDSGMLIFEIKTFNTSLGKLENKKYILIQENTSGKSRLNLYSLQDNVLSGTPAYSTSIDYNNLYEIYEWLGENNGMKFNGAINSDIVLTSLGLINRQTKKFSYLSPNRSIEIITRGLDNLDTFDDIYAQTNKFKNGIYANDIKQNDGISQFIFPLSGPKNEYKTDATRLKGSIFAISKSDIIKSNQQIKKIDNTNKDLFLDKVNAINLLLENANLGTKVDLSGYDDTTIQTLANQDINLFLETVIELTNNELRATTKDIKYKQIDLLSNKIITIDSKQQLIENILVESNIISDNSMSGENLDYINIINDNTLNFIPFSVTLKNEIKGYYLSKNNGKWELSEFVSFESYKILSDYISNLGETLTNNIDVNNYVSTLLSNGDISSELALKYYESIQNDPSIAELNNLINQYLLERLRNNEC